MGCGYSQYPLPAGKAGGHSSTVPTHIEIDEKQKLEMKWSKNQPLYENTVIGKNLKTASPKRLSPLRNSIHSEELARPQSEETKKIVERLTTENRSISAVKFKEEDALCVIKEELRSEDTAVAKKEFVAAKLLCESAVIEVLCIESKIENTLSLPLSVRSDAAEVCLTSDNFVLEGEKDKSISAEKRACSSIQTKPLTKTGTDRTILVVAVISLVFSYVSVAAAFVWLSLKAVQSIEYFVMPTPRWDADSIMQQAFVDNDTIFKLASKAEDVIGVSPNVSDQINEPFALVTFLLEATREDDLKMIHDEVVLEWKHLTLMNVITTLERDMNDIANERYFFI
jgi:hypothetical protein